MQATDIRRAPARERAAIGAGDAARAAEAPEGLPAMRHLAGALRDAHRILSHLWGRGPTG